MMLILAAREIQYTGPLMSVPVHVLCRDDSLILSVTGDLAPADTLTSAADALTHVADALSLTQSDAFAIGHFDQPP